jgi:hypothetical protein
MAILLEALVLVRGVRAKLVSKYPNFYVYVLSLFFVDGLLYGLYLWRPGSYHKWAWDGGFVILFLGSGILLEIFRHVLSPYPGAEKIAKFAGFFVIGAAVLFAVVYPIFAPPDAVVRSFFLRVQRDFLTVQAIILAGLLQVISYYRISMGRNLRGMILGYGQCLGVTLIALALRSYLGPRFQVAWSLVQQLSYLAALAVWALALWSYWPNRVPASNMGDEADYEAFAARTKDLVGAAGSQLVKVERL